MKRWLHKLFRKTSNIVRSNLQSEINNLKFLLGQSAILTSRRLSQNFKELWDAEVKIYSQWGEDGILDYICETLEISKPNIIEIGVGNFIECNSRFLAEFRNANVLAVDGRDDLVSTTRSLSVFWKSQIIPLKKWVTPNQINDIISLGESEFKKIDIFSIDLDGNDYWILKEANFTKISVVVVEYNPIFGASREVTVPRDDKFHRYEKHFSGLYYGASLCAYIELLKDKKFSFIGTNRVGSNAFFVKNDLVHKFKVRLPVELEKYVDWRIRESRDESGRLTYLNGEARLKLIKDLIIFDLPTRSEILIEHLINT